MLRALSNTGNQISPTTAKMLTDIQPGGVLLSREIHTIEDQAALVQSVRNVYAKSKAPIPLIGADYLDLSQEGWLQDIQHKKASELGFGTRIDGFDSRSIGNLAASIREICLKTISSVRAFVHKIVGINHPLGPQIEAQIDLKNPDKMINGEDVSTTADVQAQGVIPTLKHYPFTLQGMNLHKGTLSPDLSEDKLREIEKTFFGASDGHYVVMTTHVGSSNVDNGNIATFSPEWVSRLRNEIGNENLVMTDGLFMIGSYPKYLSKMSGLSENEISTYFKGSEYTAHSAPVFPWRYAYDPIFNSVKNVLKKYKDYDFRGAQDSALADPANTNNKAFQKESEGFNNLNKDMAEVLSKKFGYKFYEKDTGYGKILTSDDPEARGALAKANGYSGLLNKQFDPDKAQSIAGKMVSSFAEKAIIAGHDMVIIEGGPIKETYQNLLMRACHENPDLKKRIEESAARIEKLKKSESANLETRASPEWIKAHKADIEHLVYDIYPAITSAQDPCRMDKLNEANNLLRCLGRH